jgi:hypothetical protein
MRSQDYIKKILMKYNQVFGTLPKEHSSPFEAVDYPELDLSPELHQDVMWAVTL